MEAKSILKTEGKPINYGKRTHRVDQDLYSQVYESRLGSGLLFNNCAMRLSLLKMPSLQDVSTFLRLNLPLASILPSTGTALHAVNKNPSAPPRPVIKGCVRPGRTCHRRALLLWIVTPSRSVGLMGNSSEPSQRSSSSAVLDSTSAGGDDTHAARRATLKQSASSVRGSMLGE
jgi:hypothetical protein